MFNMPVDNVEDVVLYGRTSSDDQQERETIKSQLEFANKYVDLHKLNLIDTYLDDGITGTIPLSDRPEGRRLIEDAQNNKIKTVLIYNMKRLGRKARITLDAIYQLEEYGVTIRSMTEPFDTGTPMGRFVITVLAGQAEFDRDTLLETLWHGANRVARTGKWLGGIVPYGYRVDDNGFLEVNEDPLTAKEDMSEASVVRLMYHLIADQKHSTIKVADYFNALKIPPSYVKDGRKVKRGKRKENTAGLWSPGRIRNMVVNTTYKGLHVYGKRSNKDRELIERSVPSIVSEETWEAAQLTLKENQIEAVRNQKRQYLLRGLIKCGICGLTYQGRLFPSGSRKDNSIRPTKPYYVCGGKTAYKGPLLGKCKSKNIDAEWIENKIWDECLSFIHNPGDAVSEMEANMKIKRSHIDELMKEKDLVKKSIQEKEPERQIILNLYRQKLITTSDVEQQLDEIIKETTALENRVREIDIMIDQERDLSYEFQCVYDLLNDLRSKLKEEVTFEIKRNIIKMLVREIIINTKTSETSNSTRSGKATIEVSYYFRINSNNPRLENTRLSMWI